MALIEITEDGRCFPLNELPRLDEFNATWLRLSEDERGDIEAEINRRLDELVNSPDPNWGTITNTSIEGGKPNPITGIRGDWVGTPFQPIYEVCGCHDEVTGMFYGNVWKRVIINRDETWYGIRPDPTFPQRGIALLGKTYFLPDRA